MPPADWLGMLDGEHFADDILLADKMPEQEIVRTVPENMTNCEDLLLMLSECFLDRQAVLQCRGQRFFTHKMDLEWRQRRHNFRMQFIADTDKDAIDSWRHRLALSFFSTPSYFGLDELLPSGESLIGRGILFAPDIFGSEKTSFEVDGFYHCCDRSKAGVHGCASIGVTTRASSNDGEPRLCRIFMAVSVDVMVFHERRHYGRLDCEVDEDAIRVSDHVRLVEHH